LKCLAPDNSSANFASRHAWRFVSRRTAQAKTIVAVQHEDVANIGDGRFNKVMIATDYLKRIAAWSRELNERETEVARAGIVEKSYRANEYIFMRGDRFEYWTGVVTGLARMGIVSRGGKATSFTGLTAGAWFGEGTVLKNEARRYDVVALRDTRLAMMDRSTFFWLFENSVGFNRFLVEQLNERLGQFIALLEYGRTLDARARLARCIASLFNPILYPDLTRHLEITQEEIGALSGISRQNANQCLKRLEKEGLLRLEYGGVTIVDLERLRRYGE
jgi:CRP/FNR family cyclic AMP-dependent transcriptional regulator